MRREFKIEWCYDKDGCYTDIGAAYFLRDPERQEVIAHNPKTKHLTDGKVYVVEWISAGGFIAVKTDQGKIRAYHPSNYKPTKQ